MVSQVGRVSAPLTALQQSAENAALAAVRGYKKSFVVDPNKGYDGAGGSGTSASPLATVARALQLANPLDQIILRGKVQEEVTVSNLLGGLHFIGAGGQPRHGDSPWGGGNLWKPPASPTTATALVVVRAQGITFENILFDCPVDAAAIYGARNALSDTSEYDASHMSVLGCRFASGQSGIEDQAGLFNVKVEDSVFHALTNAIKTLGTAVAVPSYWRIHNNHIAENTNGIIVSMNYGRITDNSIVKTTTAPISTTYVSSQGGYNRVVGNSFDIAAVDFDPAGNVNGAATDTWSNYLTDAIETGRPAN